MADIGKTVDVLTALPFKDYDDEWVKSAWEKDFTDIDPLSLALENNISENDHHTENLQKVCQILDQWIHRKEGPNGEGFWTVMVENDLSYKNMTAFLAYLMEVGHRKVASGLQREAGLLAASGYFKLVTIPGSGAFKLFHPMLFQRGMDMLKSWTNLGVGKRKRQSNVSQVAGRGRGKRARQNVTVEAAIAEFSDEEDDENEMTGPEIQRVRKSILSLLKDFIQLLENFSLNQSDSSSHYAISVLSELTKQDPDLFDGNFDRVSLGGMGMAGLSYKGLLKLLSPAHGDVKALTTSVFKHLLPSMLMFIGDNKGVAAQTIPRNIIQSRDHAVEFVCFLIKNGEDSVLPVVRILLQHLCAKVPDKAEYRNKVSMAIIRILKELPDEHYATMIEWIIKFSRNGKNSYRAFSIDLIGLLLQEPQRNIPESLPEEKLEFLQQKFLVKIVLDRCSDLGPTVRARAITAFAQCLSSGNTGVLGAVQEIFTPKPVAPGAPPRLVPTPEIERAQQRTEQGDEASDSVPPVDETAVNPPPGPATDTPAIPAITPLGAKRDTPVPVNLETPTVNFCVHDNQGVISMLRRRASDDKVGVRKAAIQALENVVRVEGPSYRLQDVNVIKERCRDPALSVRRQSMQSLTDLLLNRPEDKQLQCAWLDGVLPLVMDRETSAQEKCLETLEELVLQNIVPHHRSKQGQYSLVWDLLEILAGDGGVELRRFLQKACQHWCRGGKIRPSLIESLKTHVNTDNDAGAWLLLAELAPSASKFKHQFVVDYWHSKARHCEASTYSTCERVLTVLGCITKHLSTEDRMSLIDDLKGKLLAFEFPSELVTVTVTTLSKLCDSEGSSHSQKEEWCTELLFSCDNFLSALILNENQVDLPNEEKVVRHLFTLGEIAQLCPGNTPKRVFLLVQSLIAAPCIGPEDNSSVAGEGDHELPPINEESPIASKDSIPSTQTSPEGSNADGSQTSSQGIISSQASEATPFSQGSQATRFSQGLANTQVLSQFRGSKMSSKIRAHAFVTLGKLCLQNEDVAKKCVSALARELEISQDPAIRNNVVVILCDLCVRYTTLVDRYVVKIAACLKDNSALVRKQTLTLLTRLLQEDFLKWKGVLFFRFITSLLDENKEISEFAEFCLVHLLLQRNPNMFFHHLVECVFHFNGYTDHLVYNRFQQTEREMQMFSLKGPANSSKRMKLYSFMLEHMADDQRFKLTAKLCQDVLGGVVDNIIPLNIDSKAVLEDSLEILCCKEIKLASLKSKPHDDVMDEQDMAAVVMATAKKTLITQVVKKNVIENIVPIVTSLKLILEQHRSPVLKHLMMYLRELMKDYKDEVQEILSADRQLATEIEYDLRKFEEEEKAQQQENVQRALGINSPSRTGQSPRASTSRPGSPATARPASPSATPGAGSPSSSGDKSSNPATSPNGASPKATPAPTRQMSLSTMAILNSARKAIETANRVKEIRNSPSRSANRSRLSSGQTSNRSSLAGNQSTTQSTDQSQSSGNESKSQGPERTVDAENDDRQAAPITNLFKTPDQSSKNKRAISTPSGVLGNITFHQDQNITLVPPSPIPSSLPIRVYSDNPSSSDSSPCLSPARPRGRRNQPQGDVVHMFSPDKPLPKPRSWNVTPKSKSKTKKKADKEQQNRTSDSQADKSSPEDSPKRRSSRRSRSQQGQKS